jgi:hypothetical protein
MQNNRYILVEQQLKLASSSAITKRYLLVYYFLRSGLALFLLEFRPTKVRMFSECLL